MIVKVKKPPLKVGSLTTEMNEIPHRLIVNIQGDGKAGKNTMAFGAPGNIAYFNIDRDNERLIKMMQKKLKKRIPQGRYTMPDTENISRVKDPKRIQENANHARVEWKRFAEDYLEALKAPKENIGSLVIDTGTVFWKLKRLAKFGKLLEVPMMLYEQVNAEMIYFIQKARKYDKTVVWLHRVTEEYAPAKDDKGRSISRPTGYMKMDGFKYFAAEVDANIEVYYDRKRKVFGAEILGEGMGSDARGERFEGEDCTFPNIAARIYGDEPEDWQ